MPEKNLSVSIVLPNWNGAYLLNRNLPSVIAASNGAEIIVTDDASTDESVDLLKEKFPQVKVVANGLRQGFAGNVNCGVARAHSDLVVLLNTDVQPQKGFLPPLLHHFREAQVFAVGCLEESHEQGRVTLRGRGEAKWKKGYFIHERGEINRSDTAWVAGGSGAFRKKYWDQLGGMDTLYNPFYWEDIDLSYRALKAGYKLVFEPQSVVGHFHEEGKIQREYTPTEVKRIVYRNQFIFIWKNLSDGRLIRQHAFWTPIRLLQALTSGDFLMWQGYLGALWRLPQILARRLAQSRLWRKKDSEIFPEK